MSLERFLVSSKRKRPIEMILEFIVKVAEALPQVLMVAEKVVMSLK